MRSIWTRRRLTSIAIFLIVLSPGPILAQKGGAPAASTGAGTAGGSRGNTPTPNPNTGISNIPQTNTQSITQQPIFLSGKVMFDDGSPASTDIRIERVCGGAVRLEAHTDSKGRFSFQVGQNPMAFQDASDNTTSGMYGAGGVQPMGSPGFGGFGSSSPVNQSNPLWNCELRASFPGYRSDEVDLSTRHALDPPDLGTLVLHRLVNVKGTTVSVTSELAPKPAQKAYQKGLHAAQNGKLEEADKQLTQATELYPKYATAWFALGQLQQRAGKTDDARKSFLAAASADSKYLSPYDRLALLSAQQGKWDETADYSKRVIDMNPVEFPTSFWYNALANFNLHHAGEAEDSVKALLKLDSRHYFPQAEYMYSQLLLEKNNYADAATHLRTYLTLQPNAKDADSLKAMLLKIEQASTQSRPGGPPQND